MKPSPAVLALPLALFAAAKLLAQAPAIPAAHPDTNALRLLRQTIADQTRNPDKIIRTYTNSPPKQAQLVAPAAVPPPDVPVVTAEPPRTAPMSPKAATAATLERQFLDGRMSARQYQKALADLERANKPSVDSITKQKPPAVAASPKVSPGTPPALEPASSTPPPQPTLRQQKVSEVETKIDEMIRQKEARERAAQTNSLPAPSGPLTKRQRLDFLLKQVVEGKLSDEEYKKQREKILAEPD